MQKSKNKIVCIGGGSGLSHFVKGIKDIESIELKCIVTTSDSGGSSGKLKEELNIPAVGDIRNVLVALANVPEDLAVLMNSRFDKGSLSGHSIGNLVIASMLQKCDGDIVRATHMASNIFNIYGEIIPATRDVVDIKAILDDGSEIVGEGNIGQVGTKIKEIAYVSDVHATSEAVEAILEADMIIYSIGSLFTSIVPNIIIPEIAQAIKKSKAQKVYFANLMSQAGETDGFTLSQHIEAINNHLGFQGIDFVIVNNQTISKKVLETYREEDSYPIYYDYSVVDKKIKIIRYDIAKVENGRIIHSPEKINRLFRRNTLCHFQKK